MKFLTVALVGALAVISTTHGQDYKKFIDPNAERAARVATYAKCIQECLQDVINDPENSDCQLYYPDPKKCMVTLVKPYTPCVEKCTGRQLPEVKDPDLPEDAASAVAPLEVMDAFSAKFF
ncbi:hypothetical protein EC991_001882 [Linnemannia zychae]|nr:hypothetical protein EC991_001882 [Linnemannia zychae]